MSNFLLLRIYLYCCRVSFMHLVITVVYVCVCVYVLEEWWRMCEVLKSEYIVMVYEKTVR